MGPLMAEFLGCGDGNEKEHICCFCAFGEKAIVRWGGYVAGEVVPFYLLLGYI